MFDSHFSSDISNRGPLDRLLLSELAHDDLTLAVRIALNEALYLRREAPPRSPPQHRAVLIDAGIRLWGVPRVFATAVALSLVATADRHIRVDAYRACGRTVEPVTLTRREGLVAHLEALETDAHPGDALPAFAAALPERGQLADAVVVTGEEAAADRPFQQALAALEVPSLWLATVNREGRFRLVLRRGRQTSVVREARLDLDKLLAAPGLSRPVAPLLDTAAAAVPALLRQKPFPLLLSHSPIKFRRAWAAPGGGVLSIGRDGSLLHWERPAFGARLLADNAPVGQVHWAGRGGDESTSLAVVGQLQSRRLWLLRINLATGDCRSTPLELGGGQPVGVCGHGGAVFVVYHDCAEVFEPLGWRRLQLLKCPRHSFRQGQGRFLRGRDGWYAISHDGLIARLERLVVPAWRPDLVCGRGIPQFLAVVDNPVGDGPVALTMDGHLYNFAHNHLVPVAHGLRGILRVMAIARSGERIVVTQRDDRSKMALIEVSSGASRPVTGDPAACAEPEIARHAAGARNVGHRFRAVCIDEGGHLGVERARGSLASIQLDRHQREMVLNDLAVWEKGDRHHLPERPGGCCAQMVPVPFFPKRLRVEFQKIDSPAGAGYTLHAAAWGDGSRAVLDSRGMLHLRSSQAAIPELTLVLCTGALAGWCADGRWFGTPYFIGEHVPTPAAAIYEEVLKPFAAVLYRDRLDRPDEAARCLEQGGLWTEAIALYEELGEHEKAGDLYRQLDQPDPARQAYRAAVAKYLAQNDCLAAARVLESKLDAPDEALAQLDAGWPSSGQAGACLEGLLGLLARLGGHEAAAARIEQLRRQSLLPRQTQLLVDIFSQTATTYPDAAVAAAAADATRTLAGARLGRAGGEEQRRLLEAVRRLVPADRLLGRDCQRFLRPPARPAAHPARPATEHPAVMPAASRPIRLKPIGYIELSKQVQWQAAAPAGNVCYAAGYEGGTLVVEQVFWDGRHVRLDAGPWDRLPLARRPILLAPDPRGQQPLAVASAETCQVYRTEGRRIRLEADCPGSKVEPLAVLDTADPNQFAVFGADGAIRLYQMPHR